MIAMHVMDMKIVGMGQMSNIAPMVTVPLVSSAFYSLSLSLSLSLIHSLIHSLTHSLALSLTHSHGVLL